MWALICTEAPFVCAQNTTGTLTESDSLGIVLNEVTVVARNVIPKIDAKVIIPPKSKIAASTSGLDLLQKLALPGVSVNPLTGHITLRSGGRLSLYIDGVPATESMIAALDPQSIRKLVYHDNPGMKYGNADAVIEYVTKSGGAGGRVFLESMDCIGSGKFALLEELGASLDYGKSSWAVNAGYMQMRRDNWVRDYEEVWHYPGYEVTRQESGMPVKAGMSKLSSDVSYTYTHSESDVFNARVSLAYDDTPNKEEGDRHSLMTSSDTHFVTEILEHTAEESLMPSLALSYRHIFGSAGSLNFNIEGSWMKSNSTRSYSEISDGKELCDIFSKTCGNKYGLYAEAIHEVELGLGTMTSGLRYTGTQTSNHYGNGAGNMAGNTDINQSEGSVFAEYKLGVRNWGFSGSLTGKLLHSRQHSIRHTGYAVLPGVSVSYKPNSDVFVRYSFRLGRKLPPLASMSDISQEIQPGMIRRGNPLARSFAYSEQKFSFSYISKYIILNLSVNYLDDSKPVMNSVLYDNGVFVQTFRNQKYFRRLQNELMIAFTSPGQYLTLWAAPDFTAYFSRGENYNLAKNIFHIHFGADVTYRHFIFTAATLSGADNYMYGDEIITEKPMNMILAGYKTERWAVQAGAFNLMKDYWMKTENFSPLTPFKSKAHCGKNTYFTVKLSLTLNYGKRKNPSQELPPAEMHFDKDSGIVNGLK